MMAPGTVRRGVLQLILHFSCAQFCQTPGGLHSDAPKFGVFDTGRDSR